MHQRETCYDPEGKKDANLAIGGGWMKKEKKIKKRG